MGNAGGSIKSVIFGEYALGLTVFARWPENLRCQGVVPQVRDSDQIFLTLWFFLVKEKEQ